MPGGPSEAEPGAGSAGRGAAGAALVLLAAFGSLRWGELAALRRADVDLDARTVRVERSLTPIPGGGHEFGPPKSAAGRRTVIIPSAIVPELARHIDEFLPPSRDLLFTSPNGDPCITATSGAGSGSRPSRPPGSTGIHLHDLRHAGNVFTR